MSDEIPYMTRRSLFVVLVLGAFALAGLVFAQSALAYDFTRPLQDGDSGADVKALQVRIAGFFARADRRHFNIDGAFGKKTANALVSFQSFYGLDPTGVAEQETFDLLNSMEDADGSTIHFDWEEFAQNANTNCSAQANAYAGTFEGGKVPAFRAKNNVRRVMWRLEALRAKLGGKTVGVNSGFRSVAYNDCIGGASASQHMYGTAADFTVAEVPNRLARDLGKESQFHGIGCYSSLKHNHMDIRIDNPALSSAQSWWWPERDDEDQDLDESGRPCWGEETRQQEGAAPSGDDAFGSSFLRLRSYVLSTNEVESFAVTVETLTEGAD